VRELLVHNVERGIFNQFLYKVTKEQPQSEGTNSSRFPTFGWEDSLNNKRNTVHSLNLLFLVNGGV